MSRRKQFSHTITSRTRVRVTLVNVLRGERIRGQVHEAWRSRGSRDRFSE
jgi:hypothetical protein